MATASASSSPKASNTSDDIAIEVDDNGASEMSIDQPQVTQPQHQQQQQRCEDQSSPEGGQQQPSVKQSQANVVEQKRPMNAFLLFCKKQRSLVRAKHPNLENREITRILGDWWSKLDKEQKSKYTDQARQHKQAFMEANPNFKWCKTTIVASNNNNSNHTNNNNNINESFATNNKASQEPTPASVDIHQSNNNSMGKFATSIGIHHHQQQQQQHHEAPKPPKKRYLERNESAYSNNSNSKSDDTRSSEKEDNIVPYMQLDQAMLGRVIEKALAEKSNRYSPNGSSMCNDYQIKGNSPNNWNPPVSVVEPNLFTTSAPATMANSAPTATTSSMSPYSNGNEDEPVDFSMKVTFRATNQLIIDNVIERAYSGSADVVSGAPRPGDTGSVHSQIGSSITRVDAEVT